MDLRLHKEDVEAGTAKGMMLGAPTVPTVPTTTASSSSAPLPRKKSYLQENPPSPLKAAVPTTTAQSLSSTSGPSVTPTRPRLTTTFTEVYEDQSSASDASPPKMEENVAYDDSDDDLYDD